jgi:RNA-directed DNA polymerase
MRGGGCVRRRADAAANIFSYENLLRCYYDCRARKRYTVNAAKFEENFEWELLKLQRELKSHAYKPGKSICFVVTKPKAREIFAADFRDRIVHHVLVGYLEPIFEAKFIDQSYACRKGKGVHKAIEDLRRYTRQATKGCARTAYYLQIDIRSFFVSLQKDILFEMIKKEVGNPEVLWLAKTIIFHDPTSDYRLKGQVSLFDLIPEHKSLFKSGPLQGLPIGNLTSQFFANVYLNELDQYAKHTLKVRHYLRYVDDLVILNEDAAQLTRWRDEIGAFLQSRLRLSLHPKKQVLQSVDKGIDFLGFIVRPSHVLTRRRVITSLKVKLWEINRVMEEAPQPDGMRSIQSVVNSYYGHFKHAKTFGLRSRLWEKNFGKLRNFLNPVDEEIRHFIIQERFRPRQKIRI